MRLAGDPWERLRRDIEKSLYEIVEGQATIEETQAEGEATVRCVFPGARAIRWKIEGGHLFNFLKHNLKRAADGSLLIEREGRWEVHVLELKRTITFESWSKAKHQMRCSALRLLALCGVLGIRPTAMVCHVAFRSEQIAPAATPDPILLRLPIGERAEDPCDWRRSEIEVTGWSEPVSCRYLVLEEGGQGELALG